MSSMLWVKTLAGFLKSFRLWAPFWGLFSVVALVLYFFGQELRMRYGFSGKMIKLFFDAAYQFVFCFCFSTLFIERKYPIDVRKFIKWTSLMLLYVPWAVVAIFIMNIYYLAYKFGVLQEIPKAGIVSLFVPLFGIFIFVCVSVRFMLASPYAVAGVKAPFRESWQKIKGSRWSILGNFILFDLIFVLPAAVVAYLSNEFTDSSNAIHWVLLVLQSFTNLIAPISTVYFCCVIYSVFSPRKKASGI